MKVKKKKWLVPVKSSRNSPRNSNVPSYWWCHTVTSSWRLCSSAGVTAGYTIVWCHSGSLVKLRKRVRRSFSAWRPEPQCFHVKNPEAFLDEISCHQLASTSVQVTLNLGQPMNLTYPEEECNGPVDRVGRHRWVVASAAYAPVRS